MAKAAVNKSQLIRDAIAAHPGKSNKDISEILNGKGIKVSPTYVSNIKFNMKSKKGRRMKRKWKMRMKGIHRAAGIEVRSSQQIRAAVDFIRTAGGLDAARNVLQEIEDIGKVL